MLPSGELNQPFYRSAAGVVSVWAAVRSRHDLWSHGHLRWIPQNSFDVFAEQIDNSARYVRLSYPGDPICRSRTGHRLGFLHGDQCNLVEAADVVPDEAGKIVAYHSGRCLAVGSYGDSEMATQQLCDMNSSQFWRFRDDSGKNRQRIINAMTGKCLTAVSSRSARGDRIIQASCEQHNDAQLWEICRTGNTFKLISLSRLCAEVANQSRFNGAAVRQSACNGASNQLWSIESRRGSDYELLYQADLNKLCWRFSPEPGEQAAEVREGTTICRATQSHRLGVVRGNQCVTDSSNSETSEASNYERLFQKF